MAKGSMIKYLPLFLLAALNPFSGSSNKSKNSQPISPLMAGGFQGGPIYIPKRTKLKGWQKELKQKKHYNKFRH